MLIQGSIDLEELFGGGQLSGSSLDDSIRFVLPLAAVDPRGSSAPAVLHQIIERAGELSACSLIAIWWLKVATSTSEGLPVEAAELLSPELLEFFVAVEGIEAEIPRLEWFEEFHDLKEASAALRVLSRFKTNREEERDAWTSDVQPLIAAAQRRLKRYEPGAIPKPPTDEALAERGVREGWRLRKYRTQVEEAVATAMRINRLSRRVMPGLFGMQQVPDRPGRFPEDGDPLVAPLLYHALATTRSEGIGVPSAALHEHIRSLTNSAVDPHRLNLLSMCASWHDEAIVNGLDAIPNLGRWRVRLDEIERRSLQMDPEDQMRVSEAISAGQLDLASEIASKAQVPGRAALLEQIVRLHLDSMTPTAVHRDAAELLDEGRVAEAALALLQPEHESGETGSARRHRFLRARLA